MLGFVIGVASLIGLAKLVRRGRCGGGWGHHRYGYGGGCGSRRGWGGGGECGPRGDCGPRGGCGHQGYDHHHNHGDQHFGPDGEGRSFFGRGPGRFMMRQLFWRLETTPGQERVILEAAEEVRKVMKEKRSELHSSREDIAKILAGASFDETAVGNMFSRHDDAIKSIRLAVSGALAKVHEVLTQEQRQRLAEMLNRAPGFFGRHNYGPDQGPYRA